MVTRAWKDIERAVAHLTGGERTAMMSDEIDVTIPPDPCPTCGIGKGWAVEVKWLAAPRVATIEQVLSHNKTKADAKGYGNAVVVKRKAGRGKSTPYLAIFRLSDQEEANGN